MTMSASLERSAAQLQSIAAVTAIFQAGVAAADPYLAVKNCLSVVDGQLAIQLDLAQPMRQRCESWSAIHIVALGKAACAMTKAALEVIPAKLLAEQALVVTNYENVVALDRAEVLGAGHPVPDAAGELAAYKIKQSVASLQPGALLLALVSGGGSALVTAPLAGLSFADKCRTTQLLLASGAAINEVNCVRKHLSLLKGGGLLRLAAPSAVHALILSDVLGDDVSAIASGPTVADSSTFADARQILLTYGVWERTPLAVQQVLLEGVAGQRAETLKPGDALLNNSAYTLCGSNVVSVEAMRHAAAQHYPTLVYSYQLIGEARQVAEQLAIFAQQQLAQARVQALAIIAGGETTVTLTGTGRGGRNQELALAFALAAEALQLPPCWTLLCGGTDGRDGPTDAAGAIVDASTLARIRAQQLDPVALLNDNDAYTALKSAGDLLMTGATGTNVADLLILLLQPAA